jgi:predicted TPR repeat methyltransferase
MDKVKETVATFDKYASQYQQKYDSYEPYLSTYETFSQLIGKDHVRVLDVACGPGNFASFLLKKHPGLKLTGVDLSPAMIKLATQRIPDAEFNIMDCRDIISLGATYDVIVFGFCFPYLSPDEVTELIENSAQMLSSGGLLYLSTMEGDHTRSGFQSGASGDRVYSYYHRQGFLTGLLESNGFDVVHTEKKPFTRDDGSAETDLFIYARAAHRPELQKI